MAMPSLNRGLRNPSYLFDAIGAVKKGFNTGRKFSVLRNTPQPKNLAHPTFIRKASKIVKN